MHVRMQMTINESVKVLININLMIGNARAFTKQLQGPLLPKIRQDNF